MCENNYTKAQRNYSAHKSDKWSYKQKTGILINKPWILEILNVLSNLAYKRLFETSSHHLNNLET